MKQAVAYLRKSTDEKQTHSFDRQRHSIELWAENNDFEIVAWFQEAVSGKLGLAHRPQLVQAFKIDLPVVVSSIDRLSRDVATGSAILNDRKVIVADLGMDVDSLIINILLAVAQKERELISNRVKEGMARAKVRGVTLGNPKLDKARLNSNKANRARGKRTLENYQEMILKAQKAGCVSTVDISNFLNFFGVKTTRGKDIYPSFVGRLLKKMK